MEYLALLLDVAFVLVELSVLFGLPMEIHQVKVRYFLQVLPRKRLVPLVPVGSLDALVWIDVHEDRVKVVQKGSLMVERLRVLGIKELMTFLDRALDLCVDYSLLVERCRGNDFVVHFDITASMLHL